MGIIKIGQDRLSGKLLVQSTTLSQFLNIVSQVKCQRVLKLKRCRFFRIPNATLAMQ